MFKWPWKEKEKSALEVEKERVLSEMAKMDPLDEAYQVATKRLAELTDISTKQVEKKEKLSPNAIAGGVIGLIEVIAIMSYEKGHVIATKAFGRIMRGRA